MKKVLEINIDDLNLGGVFALIKNVLENKDNNCKIDIASIEGFNDKNNVVFFEKYGANVFYIGSRKNKVLKQLYVYNNLKNLLKNNKYDNVHIHGDTANKLLISGLAAKKAGVKNIIFHSHAADVDGNHRIMKRVIHYLCKPLLKTVGATYVACSDLAAKWMYGETKYVMINNGVNLSKFRYDKNQRIITRRQLKIQDEILIGHVGRFAYQKNHRFILRLSEALDKSNIKYKIILIGTGELEQNIRNKSEELGLRNIIFYGMSNAVENLFQAMDVFILPSHFEGLPIVGIEAQASGLPVIYSSRITREAKVTDECTFIDIEDDCIELWVHTIQNYSNVNRKDTYDLLKRAKFDIVETTSAICNLYI